MNPSILIIGGGPAGSAAAAMLARAGRPVTLLERDAYPRDKLCGEFLSGESIGLLERIGCREAIEAAAPARILGWRFTAPSGRTVEGHLPAPALGISRLCLDKLLATHAAVCGARVLERTDARRLDITNDNIEVEVNRNGESETMTSSLLIGAWGRGGPLDRFVVKRTALGPPPYVGFKGHHRLTPDARGEETADALAGVVEIHAFEGGYCGMSFIETGHVNVCMLVRAETLKRWGLRGGGINWPALGQALRRDNRILTRRFDGLEPLSERPLTVAQPEFSSRPAAQGPVFFTGDATGMIPPLCGDGQAMALAGAIELTELLADLPEEFGAAQAARLGPAWRRRWRTAFSRRIQIGRAIQTAMLHPIGAEAGIALMRIVPWMAQRLVRATRGEA